MVSVNSLKLLVAAVVIWDWALLNTWPIFKVNPLANSLSSSLSETGDMTLLFSGSTSGAMLSSVESAKSPRGLVKRVTGRRLNGPGLIK